MDIPGGNRKTRCVIYDCDGVLFDSFEVNRRFYNYMCASIGRALLTEAELGYVHTHTVQEAIHFLFGNDPQVEGKALALLPRIDPQEYIPYLKMEPHLLQTLQKLKEAGIFRAINTNRSTSMKYIMEEFNLWPHFERVITALDVINPKPHPESVQKILEALQVGKDETLFVGDSEVDEQTAAAAGIRFIAYKNREIAHGAFIDDHLALLSFL